MIKYFGFDAPAVESIRGKLDTGFYYTFQEIDDPQQINADQAELILIGPGIRQPIRYVQQIVHDDKYISILILARKNEFQKIKQSLQFSPYVGKNTTVILFNEEVNFTATFQNAIARTLQKRSFARLNTPDRSRLSVLSSPSVKFENLGEALERAPIGILVVDKNVMIIGANKRSKAMFDQLHHDPIRLQNIFGAKSVDKILQVDAKGSETIVEVEDLQGNCYEITLSEFNKNGALFLLVNDITERKEKDTRLRSVLESLPQISWTADEDGGIDFFSQGWHAYTNHPLENSMGDRWNAMVHPDDLALFLPRYCDAIQNKAIFQHPFRLQQSNGDYRWHLCRAVPVPGSKRRPPSWAGTFTDIHQQVLVTEELEKKVRERTRQLEERNAELAQFVHVSSHDLQEPLRKIKTFSNMIKDESYELLAPNSKHFLDKILTTSERMSRLLKDLLNFNSLRGDIDLEDVKIAAVINHVREDLELIIAQKDAFLEVDKMPSVKGNLSEIKQLFNNLISNSLKYMAAGTRPHIRITAHEMSVEDLQRYPNLSTSTSHVEIVVKDNGIGFEQQYADQIFSLFQRLHGRSDYEGNGVGLAICKKIVVNHGGEINAISQPGQGAEFHIILPHAFWD